MVISVASPPPAHCPIFNMFFNIVRNSVSCTPLYPVWTTTLVLVGSKKSDSPPLSKDAPIIPPPASLRFCQDSYAGMNWIPRVSQGVVGGGGVNPRPLIPSWAVSDTPPLHRPFLFFQGHFRSNFIPVSAPKDIPHLLSVKPCSSTAGFPRFPRLLFCPFFGAGLPLSMPRMRRGRPPPGHTRLHLPFPSGPFLSLFTPRKRPCLAEGRPPIALAVGAVPCHGRHLVLCSRERFLFHLSLVTHTVVPVVEGHINA